MFKALSTDYSEQTNNHTDNHTDNCTDNYSIDGFTDYSMNLNELEIYKTRNQLAGGLYVFI